MSRAMYRPDLERAVHEEIFAMKTKSPSYIGYALAAVGGAIAVGAVWYFAPDTAPADADAASISIDAYGNPVVVPTAPPPPHSSLADTIERAAVGGAASTVLADVAGAILVV